MMNYARATTLRAVKDLRLEQLDFVPSGFKNSIGALLEHFAAIETLYQVRTFENRWMNDVEYERWGAGTDLGVRISELRGRDLSFYVAQLEEVRAKTLTEFAKRNDDWLLLEFPFKGETPANHHWCWFHVFEDEISHRGQIRLIRQNLPR